MLKQAVILAGGKGTRLSSHTLNTPKPMLDVGGKPFLEYIVDNLRCNGFEEIVFTIGYLGEQIKMHFGNGDNFGIKVKYVEENEPSGTGGGLLLGIEYLQDDFLVLNGDTVFDFNIWDLYKEYCKKGVLGAIALRTIDDVSRYGCISLENGYVKGFSEKGMSGKGEISGGCYILSKKVIEKYASIPCSIESDVFPALMEVNQLIAKKYDGFFIDIGIPDTLKTSQTLVPEWWKKPVAFLDRDGVINKDLGYVVTENRCEWVAGALSAIKSLNEHGYRVIIVTNQAGIARGYYSIDDFHLFMDLLLDRIKEHGAHVDDYFFCPHHFEHGKGKYKMECDCRKPSPGMIFSALNRYPVDIDASFLVGDKDSDIIAADRAGIRGYKFSDEEEALDLLINRIIGLSS